MLTLTDNAADVVKKITDQIVESEESGLRISEGNPADAGGLAITAADRPEPGDHVVDEDGARVFLDETASTMLDDKVLDAQVDPDGTIQFGIGQQD